MSTIFYKHLASKKAGEIPLTFLMIEVLELMQDSLGEMNNYAALQLAAEWSGVLGSGEALSEEQADSLLRRIVEPAKAAMEAGKEKPVKLQSSKRTFASEFLKSYEKLSLQDKCLHAAGYDFELARCLYCVYDKSVSEEIIRKHFDMEFSRMQVGYEAVVFGMGGSFGGGPGDVGGEVVDFAPPPDSDDYISAAQNFVNMQKSYRGAAR